MKFIQFVFSIWPIIFLFGWVIPARRGLSRGARLRVWLERVLLAWFLWALIGIFLFINGIHSSLIREPMNSILFIGSGALLLASLAAPAIHRMWLDHQLISQSRAIEDLYLLSPRQFEALIATCFQRYGFDVELSGRSGDHGIDLIVSTRNGERWVVQCKRWKAGIGEPVLRDLYGAMHHEGASRAFLMTTGSFTQSARHWAKDKPITLYDGPGLIRLLHRVQRKTEK